MSRSRTRRRGLVLVRTARAKHGADAKQRHADAAGDEQEQQIGRYSASTLDDPDDFAAAKRRNSRARGPQCATKSPRERLEQLIWCPKEIELHDRRRYHLKVVRLPPAIRQRVFLRARFLAGAAFRLPPARASEQACLIRRSRARAHRFSRVRQSPAWLAPAHRRRPRKIGFSTCSQPRRCP